MTSIPFRRMRHIPKEIMIFPPIFFIQRFLVVHRHKVKLQKRALRTLICFKLNRSYNFSTCHTLYINLFLFIFFATTIKSIFLLLDQGDKEYQVIQVVVYMQIGTWIGLKNDFGPKLSTKLFETPCIGNVTLN